MTVSLDKNMKMYLATIRADKWPSEFYVQGSNFGTALSRAYRQWRKANKGTRTSELTVRIIESDNLKVNEN